MKMHSLFLAAFFLPLTSFAQVNSGSNGSDGALNPASNVVIDMADHPDGIYHYTSVNIPAGVTVSFIPNAGNKPVVWLVQGNCTIAGTVDISGRSGVGGSSGLAGPGGWSGGSGGSNPMSGNGPGGGSPGFGNSNSNYAGGNGSFGTKGAKGGQYWPVAESGTTYGSAFLFPLTGGSGGGGGFAWSGTPGNGGGGGGGAILVAASQTVSLNGSIVSNGGNGNPSSGGGGYNGGGGSGGAIRLVAQTIAGSGSARTDGGSAIGIPGSAGAGRIRFDAYQLAFGGVISGQFTQGFQPIIIPAPGQGIQLALQSLAGMAVAASPSGVLANPDIIIPAQQTNPIPIVVHCTNIPLNTEISVVVHPANGPDVQAVGLNNAGTAASSTATVSLNLPRGGGIIYATAVTGIAGSAAIGAGVEGRFAKAGAPSPAREARALPSLAETGWTADGERFEKMEITTALGGAQRVTYITASGKRYEAN